MESEFGVYDPAVGLPGGELTEALYGEDQDDDEEDDVSGADDSARQVVNAHPHDFFSL